MKIADIEVIRFKTVRRGRPTRWGYCVRVEPIGRISIVAKAQFRGSLLGVSQIKRPPAASRHRRIVV